MKHILFEQGVDVTKFKSWHILNELRLVANAVKHGDGTSAEELKARNPKLFEERFPELFGGLSEMKSIRPLVGEGLRLSEESFEAYRAGLGEFWSELIDALLPVLGPEALPAAESPSR